MSLDAWILVNAHPKRNRRIINQLLFRFKTAENILGKSSSQLCSVPGVSTEFANLLLDQPEKFDLRHEKELIEKFNVNLLLRGDPAYPSNLENMDSPPPLLYIRGEVDEFAANAVSIIGSRENSSYGANVCNKIASDIAYAGFTVVSGLARGIDTIAHESALKAGGNTIAVLGNGQSRYYPPENELLQNQIAKIGAVITEYPMEWPPRRKHFPERNGLIAGLSLGVCVIEARKKSGSLITARAALEENRSVYAVPGNIFAHSSEGTNSLIRDGAQLVRCADDILEDIIFNVHLPDFGFDIDLEE